MTMLPNYFESEAPKEFHSVMSVELGELIEGKWVNWDDESWHWDAFDDEQYKRVCEKFNNRYFHRDIGILPPGQWKREVLRKFNEIMPKYKPVYQALKDGADILQMGNEYGKSRDVYSDFPATQLKNATQDYASNASDRQYERIQQGDWIQKMTELQDYNDVDAMILDELSGMFSGLYTVNTSYLY